MSMSNETAEDTHEDGGACKLHRLNKTGYIKHTCTYSTTKLIVPFQIWLSLSEICDPL